MRSALLILALVACSSTDPPADAARADAACTPGMFLGRCMCGTELTGSVSCLPSGFGTTGCVCPDAATPTDATSDAPAADGSEVSIPDAPAPEDRPALTDAVPDAPRCPMGLAADCFGSSVNLQMGVPQSDGTTLHCGACGNTCARGTFCLMCRCER